ncbi:MAG: lipid-A-disaccharide synthase [Xanthomonadales bacterium]|nr:lipid-A-disaccharide synthase [Gammaproteobacteria bacterium]NNK38846.1 lipid-A-disaccharide synthase [Xanthomonadales bacterium]
MPDRNPTIALVAGETSGDQLGAALIHSLRSRFPQARFVGIGGPGMQNAGLEAWWDSSELAVMGLFEVLSHLPRLLKIRRELRRRLLELKPDLFIGIDAPDFNLGLEIALRRRGIRTVHYVSPTVWIWRKRRVHKIARAADLVLCLFPFEPAFYERHHVPAVYVGHPMADQIEPDPDPVAARKRLGLTPRATTVALLPGSRESEVSRLAAPMIEAARLLAERRPEIQFVAAMASPDVDRVFAGALAQSGFTSIRCIDGRARTVIASADAVMCASGTATLETLLVNRPLVMTYVISASSYQLAKQLRLIRPQSFSLPNILAGEALIPELIQKEATGPALAAAVSRWLDDEAARDILRRRFLDIHEQLRCGASEQAASAVEELLSPEGTRGRAG